MRRNAGWESKFAVHPVQFHIHIQKCEMYLFNLKVFLFWRFDSDEFFKAKLANNKLLIVVMYETRYLKCRALFVGHWHTIVCRRLTSKYNVKDMFF